MVFSTLNKEWVIKNGTDPKIQLKDQSTIEYYDNLQIRKDKKNQTIVQYLKTTTGRVIFNFTIQKSLNLL